MCEIALDTDTWFYGTHIERALTSGACVAPCDPADPQACPTGQTCEPTSAVVGQPSATVCHVAGT